jgi:undecaprenyl-diphosphatase
VNDILVSIILGIVEGITEFLPVSSTGHLIILSDFLAFKGDFADTFNIFIQLGAILSVIVYFRKRLFGKGAIDLWKKAALGVIPAIIIGATIGSYLESVLFDPIVVASALLVGGIILITIELRKRHASTHSISTLTYKTAFYIGLIQCLAFIPGTSRSAATIIGAMLLGASRVLAAEYSFFLAIPTLSLASGYSLLKAPVMSSHEIMLLSIGFIVSFIVALAVIAGFMKYISTRDFKPFGYYRIALGIAVLAYFLL